MRICFDLDETLCSGKPYDTAQPIIKNINLLKELKCEGHTIIIYTARGMGRTGSNSGKSVALVGKLTFEQLEKWGVTYDEIHFGKPSADLYIDDKAINVIDVSASSIREKLCQIKQTTIV